MHRISIGRGIECSALGEMAGVTGDTERRLLMETLDAIDDAATARCIGEPGITGTEDVIGGGADGLPGIVIRRCGIDTRPQFVLGMIGVDANAILAGFAKDARR